jgi:hypothetical protein
MRSKLFSLLLVAFLVVLVVGCAGGPPLAGPQSPTTGDQGGDPVNLDARVQGAQIQEGNQGQVGETGSATTYANPTIIHNNFFGKSKIRVVMDEKGKLKRYDAETDGGAEIVGARFEAPRVRYGEDAARAEVSSGGGGAAGVEGGATTRGRTRSGAPAPKPAEDATGQ